MDTSIDTTTRQEAEVSLQDSIANGPSPSNAALPVLPQIDREQTNVYRTPLEALSAVAEQTLHELTPKTWLDAAEVADIRSKAEADATPKVSAAILNQQYPFMSRPFTEDTHPEVAKYLAERQLTNIGLQGVVDGANEGRLMSTAKFATQLAVGALDPINMIAGYGTGAAFGALSGATGFGASLALDSSASLARQLTVRSAHNIIGNIAMEPLRAGTSAALQEDYNLKDSLANDVKMGVGLSALHLGVSEGLKFAAPKLRALFRSAPKADAIAANSADAALNAGKTVDVSGVVNDVSKERRNPTPEPPDARLTYSEFDKEEPSKPISQPRDFVGRPFYQPMELMHSEPGRGLGYSMGREYGDGIYLTDSPEVANGYAASKYNDNRGGITEFEFSKDKPTIIDLDNGLPAKAKAVAEAMWEKWRPTDLVREVAQGEGQLRDQIAEPKSDFPELKGKSAQFFFDHINDGIESGLLPPGAMNEFTKGLKSVGIDGAHFQDDIGNRTTMVFDPDKSGHGDGVLAEKNRYYPDESKIPQMTSQDVQEAVDKYMSVKSDTIYSEAAHEAITEAIRKPAPELTVQDAEARLKQVNEDVQAFAKQKELSPKLQAEFDAIDKEMKDADAHDAILKAAFSCMAKGSP